MGGAHISNRQGRIRRPLEKGKSFMGGGKLMTLTQKKNRMGQQFMNPG